MNCYLAFDLGAESGRAMLGSIGGGRLSLEELHRFPNTPVRVPSGLYWDALGLFHEIEQGLAAASRRPERIEGIGIDTWGVDFALLGEDGALLDNPRHYRDGRNNGMLEKTFAAVPREEIFRQTGVQFMQINSLYQLHAMSPQTLAAATRLLFMPDLFNYWLTGVRKTEHTIASTSQFYNPVAKRFATELLEKLRLPTAILPEIVTPGTQLGACALAPVYATASHDTASAVAAVPAQSGDDWCYISSGTWSLMGVELDEPVINEQSLAGNFTNEVGVGGKIRFLKNIAGLWLLQECRRAWAQAGREYSYDELMQMAAAARPHVARIDPDAFLEPGEMPEKIAAHCREAGQAVPEQPGEICRAILESLAARYREVLDRIESLTGRTIRVIHIVGGGSRNKLLNQLVANATGRRVIAGPAEATAAGNILTQAIGAGHLKDLEDARRVVRASFEVSVFEPQ